MVYGIRRIACLFETYGALLFIRIGFVITNIVTLPHVTAACRSRLHMNNRFTSYDATACFQWRHFAFVAHGDVISNTNTLARHYWHNVTESSSISVITLSQHATPVAYVISSSFTSGFRQSPHEVCRSIRCFTNITYHCISLERRHNFNRQSSFLSIPPTGSMSLPPSSVRIIWPLAHVIGRHWSRHVWVIWLSFEWSLLLVL